MKNKYYSTTIIVIIIMIFGFSGVARCRSLEDIKRSGYIRIALYNDSENYTKNPDGSFSGFNYEMAEAVAKYFNVKLEIVEVAEWNRFFSKDEAGLVIDKTAIYNPYIFENEIADVIVAGITKLEWRNHLIQLVKFAKNKQILYAADAKPVKRIQELSGRVLVRNNTSFYDNFQKNILPKSTKITPIYTDKTNTFCVSELLAKNADYGIMDSFSFFLYKKNNKELNKILSISQSEDLC